jgi:predicted nucleic acid-binding Zn finger protein
MTIPISHVSEVVQLRQQIALECEALNRALHSPAIMASHAVITNRYKQLDCYYDQLSQIVGEQEATEMAVTIYENIVK